MRQFVLTIALFFCVQGILPLSFGQSQPSAQTPVTSQPPVPASQPPAQPPNQSVQYVQVPAAQPQYQANPAILNQYGVQQVAAAPVQMAYATPAVYGMQGPPIVAASGPVLTTSGSLQLGGGPIAQWLVARAGKTHTWNWNHTVTRPTVTPAVSVPVGPTSYVATMAAPVQMVQQPVQMVQQPAPPVQQVYYQAVTTMQPYIAYQPVTTMQPVTPPAAPPAEIIR